MTPREAAPDANGASAERLNAWLRFAPAVQRRHDREFACARAKDLRTNILFGLILYNVYCFTAVLLRPEIYGLAIALRLGFTTATALAAVWLMGRVSAKWTERLAIYVVLNAYSVPLFLFWLSDRPSTLFTFPELSLVIIFANMLLALRFREAVWYSIGTLAATAGVVLTKAGVPADLQFAFLIQIATAGIFSLFANYQMERRRCVAYLAQLSAQREVDSADDARRRSEILSRVDSLTNLPNRRYLGERLDEWFAQVESMSVAMIDIDCFKAYNDTLGHPAGDDCLRRISDMLVEQCAGPDLFCARFGGEEFTIIMRGADRRSAQRTCENVLQALRSLAIPHPARADGVPILTCSIGLVNVPHARKITPRVAVEEADLALYRAKKEGRDRLVFRPAALDRMSRAA